MTTTTGDSLTGNITTDDSLTGNITTLKLEEIVDSVLVMPTPLKRS